MPRRKRSTPVNQGTQDETLAGKSMRGEEFTAPKDSPEGSAPNLTPYTADAAERRGFRCGECKAEFTSEDDLQRHEDHMHSNILVDSKSGHSGPLK